LFDPKFITIAAGGSSATGLAQLALKLRSGSEITAASATLSLSDQDLFGQSVALAADRLAVGAEQDSTGGSNRGAVYLFDGLGSSGTVNTPRLAFKLAHGSSLASGSSSATLSLSDSDKFGRSAALAGARLAVGAPGDDTGGSDLGAVYLFDGLGSSGTLSLPRLATKLAHNSPLDGSTLTLTGLGSPLLFGHSVALSADRLAVGAVADNTAGAANTGSVYLFDRLDTSLATPRLFLKLVKDVELGTGTLSLPTGGGFGASVSLNEDRLAVGSYYENTTGAVRLFHGLGSSGALQTPEQPTTLTQGSVLSNVTLSFSASDSFGSSVALSGERLAVGAPGDNTGGQDRGAVYLFDGLGTSGAFSSLSSMRQAFKLADGFSLASGSVVPSLSFSNDSYFGQSVAFAADRLAVGHYHEDLGGTNRGLVYLFDGLNSTGQIQQPRLAVKLGSGSTLASGSLSYLTLANSDNFGSAVALSADRLAVGAYSDDTGSADAGAVYLFDGLGSSGAVSTPRLAIKLASGSPLASGGTASTLSLSASDRFGSGVALAADRLAVGAAGDDTGGSDFGAVYLFDDLGSSGLISTPRLAKKLADGAPLASGNLSLTSSGMFGWSVALSADRLAVGAPFDDTGGIDRGAVYLFDGLGSSGTIQTPNQQAKLASGFTLASGSLDANLTLSNSYYFGSSVALSADRLAVGLMGDDTGGQDRGSVYLFNNLDSSGPIQTPRLVTKLVSGFALAGSPATLDLANDDDFGYSVAMSGDRLVVGSRRDDTGGTDRGAVYVFDGLGASGTVNTPRQTTKLAHGSSLDSTGIASSLSLSDGDHFGVSVAVSSDRLAVGAEADDTNGTDRGAAYVFSTAALTGSRSYSISPGGPDLINNLSLASLLSTGQSVTLQANSDITQDFGAPITVNNPSGDGGALTLQAGRSLFLNDAITTDNGALTLIANDRTANGVLDAHRDAGAAVITMAPTGSINAGTGAVNITLRDGQGLTNSTSGAITLGSITAGTLTVQNQGPTVNVSGINILKGIASGSQSFATTNGDIIVSNDDPTSSMVVSSSGTQSFNSSSDVIVRGANVGGTNGSVMVSSTGLQTITASDSFQLLAQSLGGANASATVTSSGGQTVDTGYVHIKSGSGSALLSNSTGTQDITTSWSDGQEAISIFALASGASASIVNNSTGAQNITVNGASHNVRLLAATGSTAKIEAGGSSLQDISVGGYLRLEAAGGTPEIRNSGTGSQTISGNGIALLGSSATNSIAQIVNESSGAAQNITAGSSGLTVQAGNAAGGNASAFITQSSLASGQTVTVNGGQLLLAGGTNNATNSAQISNATGIQTIAVNNGPALSLTAQAGGAFITSAADQSVTIQGASSANALLIGGVSSANASGISGSNQVITAGTSGQTGSITVRGGTAAGKNGFITSNSGTQEVKTTGLLAMVAGSATGTASNCATGGGGGSCASIANLGSGLQTVDAGSINMQGAPGGKFNLTGIFPTQGSVLVKTRVGGLTLQASPTIGAGISDNPVMVGGAMLTGNTITLDIAGDTTLSGGATTNSSAFIGMTGSGTDKEVTIDFINNQKLTLNGGSAVGTGAAIGAGSSQNSAITNITINATDVTLNDGTGSGARIGHALSPTVNGLGDIAINASGNIFLNGANGTGTLIKTLGNVTLDADAVGKSINQTGPSAIIANQLTASANAGISLAGTLNGIGSFNATNAASGNVSLTNTTPTLAITGINQSGGGSVTVTNNGGIDTTGTVATGANGGITLNASGDQSISAPITAGGTGTITLGANNLTVTDAIVTSGGAMELTTTGNLSLDATNSLTRLNAGGLLTIDAGGTVSLTGGMGAGAAANAFGGQGVSLQAGTLDITGGMTGPANNFASITTADGKTITANVTGNTLLTGGATDSGALIGLGGTGSNQSVTVNFTGGGSLQMDGGTGGTASVAFIGASGTQTNATTDLTVSASSITLNDSAATVARFGHSSTAPGPGNISITATSGNIALNSSGGGMGSFVRTQGNASLSAPNGSITAGALSAITGADVSLSAGGTIGVFAPTPIAVSTTSTGTLSLGTTGVGAAGDI
jgi:hypothetical protein